MVKREFAKIISNCSGPTVSPSATGFFLKFKTQHNPLTQGASSEVWSYQMVLEICDTNKFLIFSFTFSSNHKSDCLSGLFSCIGGLLCCCNETKSLEEQLRKRIKQEN